MAEEAAGLGMEGNGPKPEEEEERSARPDTNIGEDKVIAEQNANEEDNVDNPVVTLDEEQQELTDQERVQLYEKALKFKTKQSYKHALLCFLGCIKGIHQDTKFSFLPNCLQNIASIYAKFEDFPKAVQFMQAAKMYYETALIGSQPNDEGNDYKTMDENATDEQAKRANEYEKLSHDCLLEKNVPLALEYCGKATQLRRKFYGENHPVTVKSLDLFTMIYAEMGKMQYSEAIGKFDKDEVEIKQEGKEKKHSEKKVRFKDEIDEMTSKEDDLGVSFESKVNHTETVTMKYFSYCFKKS